MKNKRALELVTSLSLGCKACLGKCFLVIYHLENFDDALIQSGFTVIQKITFAFLCKPIHDAIIIPVSYDLLNLETVEKKEKKNESFENKKRFLDEITFFS